MMTFTRLTGIQGESMAAEYLENNGYAILERNARTPYGEIDLVAQQASVTVFVEVKTRRSTRYGNPEESVTPIKRVHLLSAIQSYLQSHPELDGDWRVDVIAIQLNNSAAGSDLTHFENAIS